MQIEYWEREEQNFKLSILFKFKLLFLTLYFQLFIRWRYLILHTNNLIINTEVEYIERKQNIKPQNTEPQERINIF